MLKFFSHPSKVVLVSLILIFLFTGCSKAQEEKGDKEIVRINGVTYTMQDLWDYANVIIWEMEPKDLNNDSIKESLLQEFVNHKMLYQEAKRIGIQLHSESLEQLNIQLESMDGAKELKSMTGYYDIDPHKTLALMRERLMVDELLKTVVLNTPAITEKELRDFYESKKISRSPVGQAHIYHIFTTDNETANKAAKELASGILFAEVAAKYSEGEERKNGGDLGFINKDVFPDFFSKAFTLKEGEISPIIQSDYGYHIFKMVQYARASRHSYNNVKKQLIAELYAIKRDETITEYINALHNSSIIQYLNNFTLAEFKDKLVKS